MAQAKVISFASSKGGAGKTTACIVIGEELARAYGQRVVMLDVDPGAHLLEWSQRAKASAVRVVGGITEETVIETIEEQGRGADFVLVDLEGRASMAVTYAVSKSDLVLIPAQASGGDLREALRALALLKRLESVVGRPIMHRVLISKARVLRTNMGKWAREELGRLGSVVLGAELMDRVALAEMTVTGQTPGQVDPKSNAALNVQAVTTEILAVLGRPLQMLT